MPKSNSQEILALAKSTYNQAFEHIASADATKWLEGLELSATSLHLWRQVGTDKNVAIGLWLFSRALHKVGANEQAIETATESVRLARVDGTDWLIASGLEGLARASQGASAFESNREAAAEAIAAIADPADRELIASQFADLNA